MDGGHAIEIFVDGADQNLAPESLDRAGSLFLFAQPIEHGDALEIGPLAIFFTGRQQAARDAEFVGHRQEMKLRERFGQMERSAKPSALHNRNAAARLDPIELAPEVDTLDYFEP